jgi:thiol-disulfide isomerase/thioredoxin
MSTGLLFLDSDDYYKTQGQKGPILCHKIKGLSLIFYYSTECPHCQSFIPEFKKLPGRIGGCQFGMVNINKNIKLIKLSQNTIAPIQFVPYIMLYVDGKPFIRYDGEHNLDMIMDFIIDVNKKLKKREQFLDQERQKQIDMIQQKQTSSQQGFKQNNEIEIKEINGIPLRVNNKDRIPAYTIGIPKNDDDLFYLEYNEAYQSFERKK